MSLSPPWKLLRNSWKTFQEFLRLLVFEEILGRQIDNYPHFFSRPLPLPPSLSFRHASLHSTLSLFPLPLPLPFTLSGQAPVQCSRSVTEWHAHHSSRKSYRDFGLRTDPLSYMIFDPERSVPNFKGTLLVKYSICLDCMKVNQYYESLGHQWIPMTCCRVQLYRWIGVPQNLQD